MGTLLPRTFTVSVPSLLSCSVGAGAVELLGEGAAWRRRQGTLQQDWGLGQTSGSCCAERSVLAAAGFLEAGWLAAYSMPQGDIWGASIACTSGTCFLISLLNGTCCWHKFWCAKECQALLSMQRLGGQGRSVEMWHVIGKSSFLSSCRLTFLDSDGLHLPINLLYCLLMSGKLCF